MSDIAKDAFIIDEFKFRLEHYQDTAACYDVVREFVETYWSNRKKSESYDNYRFDIGAPGHALGTLLKNNGFELGFSLLYKDEVLHSIGGIRLLDAFKDGAIVMSRHLSVHSLVPIAHGVFIPKHFELLRRLNIEFGYITINSYQRWHEVWHHKAMAVRKNRNPNSQIYLQAENIIHTAETLGLKNINQTEQTVLRWRLSEPFKK